MYSSTEIQNLSMWLSGEHIHVCFYKHEYTKHLATTVYVTLTLFIVVRSFYLCFRVLKSLLLLGRNSQKFNCNCKLSGD